VKLLTSCAGICRRLTTVIRCSRRRQPTWSWLEASHVAYSTNVLAQLRPSFLPFRYGPSIDGSCCGLIKKTADAITIQKEWTTGKGLRYTRCWKLPFSRLTNDSKRCYKGRKGLIFYWICIPKSLLTATSLAGPGIRHGFSNVQKIISSLCSSGAT